MKLMIDNVKSIVLAIVALIILGGVYYVVDEYTSALAYVKKYEEAQAKIVELEADVKRLEQLVGEDSQLGADFVTERDGIHQYFGGLEDQLWNDFRCASIPGLDAKLPIVAAPAVVTKAPVKSTPTHPTNNHALSVAWKAYCSTVDTPVDGCEVVK